MWCCSEPTNGAEVVALKLEMAARRGSHGAASTSGLASANGSSQGLADMRDGGKSPRRAGSVRLRDAIVWGYMMQRHDKRDKVTLLHHQLREHLGSQDREWLVPTSRFVTNPLTADHSDLVLMLHVCTLHKNPWRYHDNHRDNIVNHWKRMQITCTD